MISSQSKQTIEYLFQTKVPNLHEMPLDLVRNGLRQQASLIPPPDGCSFETVNAGGVSAVWVRSQEVIPNQALIYLHGGGYTLGSPDTHASLIATLSKLCSTSVLAVDYRLAPEYPYPAALDDASNAYLWLIEQGYKPTKLIIGGDSAGGGLTLATLLRLKSQGKTLPAAAICLSPWVDLECRFELIEIEEDQDPMISKAILRHFAALYAGQTSRSLPFISPLNGDLTGLPPVLIQVGTSEILRSDAQRMADALSKYGVDCTLQEWEQMYHVFQLATFLPEAMAANQEVANFISAHLNTVIER